MRVLILTFIYFLFSNTIICQEQQKIDENSPEFKEIVFLYKKAEEYQSLKKVDKAISSYKRILQKFETNYGSDHQYYGTFLNNLAFLYTVEKKYEEALSLYLKALENTFKTQGKNSAYYNILKDLAKVYKDLEQYKKALPLFIEVLENSKKSIGVTHPKYAVHLSNLASVYEAMGKYKLAFPLYNEAKKNTEEALGKDHKDYGICLKNLARLHELMGQYSKALALQLEAINNTEKNFGIEHLKYGIDSSNLAGIYQELGDYEQALFYYEQALQIIEKKSGKNLENYFIFLNNLANLYMILEEYEKAYDFYNQALESIEKNYGKSYSYYGTVLNNLAQLYYETGQLIKAFNTNLESLRHAEEKFGKNHPQYAIRLAIRAGFFTRTTDIADAVPMLSESLDILKETLGRSHPYYLTSLSHLAFISEFIRDYETAYKLYAEILELTEQSLGVDHPDYGATLYQLATVLYKMDMYEKALFFYLKSAFNAEKNFGKNHSTYVERLKSIALWHQDLKLFEGELILLKEYNANILNQIKNNFSYLANEEKKNYIDFVIIDGLMIIHDFNYRTNNENKEALKISINNIITSKNLLLKNSKNILNSLKSLNQESINKKIDSLVSKRKYVNKQLQLPIKIRNESFEQIKEETMILERELMMTYSKKFGEKTSFTKNFKETRVKDDELAIEFINFELYDKKLADRDSIMYVAYLYKKGWESPKVVNLFEEKQLKKYLTSNASPNKLYKSRGGKVVDKKGIIADSIYNLVWKPLEPYTQNASAIYYSPDGLLHKIPFAVLPNKDNKLLGERYNLNQMGNTADVRKNNKLPDLNDILLIGGVDYNYTISNSKKDSVSPQNDFSVLQSEQLLGNIDNKKRSNGDGIWDYLEGTNDEVKTIKALLPKSKILTKKKATEKAFKSLSGNSPSVLHIATHGYFFPNIERKKEAVTLGNEKPYIHSENPLLRSGLILANANYAWKHGSNPYEEEDGILTALEISNLNLRNTDIVILSACETGLGDIPSSEGVYGLQRAFKMAGVETIIMTLWEVPDTETAEFMNLFYTKWKTTNNPKKAFKETQRLMMNRYRNDPEKWAAFVYFE